jgi:hypothetical protein
MNFRFALYTVSVAVLLNACASQQGAHTIDQVAKALERSQVEGLADHSRRIFPSTLQVLIFLPSNAPPAQVAKRALEQDFLSAYGASEVVAVRKVRIQTQEYVKAFDDAYNPVFTAVLLKTALGPRVVLLQFHSQGDLDWELLFRGGDGYWCHWIIDPDHLLNKHLQSSLR